MMSPDESTGINRQTTPSTPMSQEMCLWLRALPQLLRLHEDKNKTEHREEFSQKRGVSSTPVRHAADPYQRQRHPDAQEKLKHYILSTKL